MSIDDLSDDEVLILAELGSSGWGASWLPVSVRPPSFEFALQKLIVENMVEGRPSDFQSDGENLRYHLTVTALELYSPVAREIDRRASRLFLARRAVRVQSIPYGEDR